jgi:ankyrin repeat protein
MLASENDHFEIVKYLVEKEADVNAKDENNQTALILASNANNSAITLASNWYHSLNKKGHFEIVKYLVDNGAQVNAKDNYDRTALMFACENGHLEMVKFFVEKVADVNEKDVYGRTPLIRAYIHGYSDIVSYLAENGAEINVNGISPWSFVRK